MRGKRFRLATRWPPDCLHNRHWSPPDPATRPGWAINRALRKLGADRGQALDEFEELRLGRHRCTEDWHPAS